MLVTGAADSITPSTVSLDHTNLPFQTVDIAARSPSNDVQVHIRSDFDPAGIELSVPVVRPVLSVGRRRGRFKALGSKQPNWSWRREARLATGCLR